MGHTQKYFRNFLCFRKVIHGKSFCQSISTISEYHYLEVLKPSSNDTWRSNNFLVLLFATRIFYNLQVTIPGNCLKKTYAYKLNEINLINRRFCNLRVMIPTDQSISRYHYPDILQPLGNDTRKSNNFEQNNIIIYNEIIIISCVSPFKLVPSGAKL